MQPNQTMVGPIAKQCLESLGRPPSLWSLETLVNAGIMLGFNGRRTLTPSTLFCVCTDTYTYIYRERWRDICTVGSGL